jgi:molybdopterin-guanine dinucleotide biosynthesis protein A
MPDPKLNHVSVRRDYGIEGFILIGGASSRMGSDKALLELGGRTFVDRIAGALYAVAETVRCVGGKESSPPGLVNVPDVHHRWGALGGLHAALSACDSEWAAVVACDLPFVTGDLFKRLAMLRDDFDTVIPVQSDSRPQPLCGLYRPRSCLPKAAALIANRERRPRTLLTDVNTRWVKPEELDDLTGAGNFFWNINAPGDYARAQALVSEGQIEN